MLDAAAWIGPSEDAPLERVEEVGDLAAVQGSRPRCCPTCSRRSWSKLIFNATVNSVAALTGLRHDPTSPTRAEPSDLGHLVHELVDEGKAVAAAAGVELYEDPWEMNVHATRRGSAHYPSMLEDVEARRPTEIDLITGSLVRKAKNTECRCRCTRRCTASSRRKEASWREPESRTVKHQEA